MISSVRFEITGLFARARDYLLCIHLFFGGNNIYSYFQVLCSNLLLPSDSSEAQISIYSRLRPKVLKDNIFVQVYKM